MEEICKLKDIYKSLYSFEKDFADKNGITINEGMILCCMKDGKARSANELCDFLGLSNSRVSRVINAVETKGYITRQMGIKDKRQMIFSLTQEGKRKIKQMQKQELNFSDLKNQLSKLID
jgi:DNA-binding MarR family transcriptional regulator